MQRQLRLFKRLVPLLALAALLSAAPARADGRLESIDITTSAGPQKFSVEMMQTDAEHERGLMFRRYMPDDRGMLFNFHKAEPVMMWMKNTYIPLDMIFTDQSGTITTIIENAEPMSETILPSNGPVFSVLEVNGGTVARLKIQRGDKMHASIFEK